MLNGAFLEVSRGRGIANWSRHTDCSNAKLQLTYLVDVLYVLVMLFAKTATLLLFYPLFTVSTRLRLAIRIGLGVNFALYVTSLVLHTYYSTPHNGMTWDDLLFESIKAPVLFELYWGLITGTIGTVLDIYIFVLPLPVTLRLNLSKSSRIQVIAIFSTALL